MLAHPLPYQPKSYSPIKYLNRVSWDNYAEMLLGIWCRGVATTGIVLMSLVSIDAPEKKERIEEIVSNKRKRAPHVLPNGDCVYLKGIRVLEDGTIQSVIDTVGHDTN